MVFRMNYVMIPANIAYFVLGFISCFALIVIYATIGAKKEMKKKEEMVKKLFKQLQENDDDEK